MRQGHGIAGRYIVYFFAAYLLLFFAAHDPIRHGGLGVLARAPEGYLQGAGQLNPLHVLNMQLSDRWRSPLARSELVAAFALLLAVYLRALHRARSHPKVVFDRRAILIGIVAFSPPLLLLPYIFSQDIYAYIMYGRMAAIHGANPTMTVPSDYPQDPFFQLLIYWKHVPAAYGPIWLLFSDGLTLLIAPFGDAVWPYLIAYKLAALGFHIANTLLLWSILGRWKPEQQSWGTLLYAWNPLALVELVGSGHNDGLVVGLILLALWWTARGGWRRAIVALSCAALVKWALIVLLPLYGLFLLGKRPAWRERMLIAGQGAALALIAAAAFYLPYWHGPQSLRALTDGPAATQEINSLGALAVRRGPAVLYWLGLGPDPELAPHPDTDRWRDQMELLRFKLANSGARHTSSGRAAKLIERDEAIEAERDLLFGCVVWVSKAAVLLAWLVAAAAVWRTSTAERFVQGSFWVLLVALVFAPWFWPWYLTWPLGLAALLDWRPAGQAIVAFTATAPLIYVTLYSLSPLRLPLLFLPVLGLLSLHLWREWRRWRQAAAVERASKHATLSLMKGKSL